MSFEIRDVLEDDIRTRIGAEKLEFDIIELEAVDVAGEQPV